MMQINQVLSANKHISAGCEASQGSYYVLPRRKSLCSCSGPLSASTLRDVNLNGGGHTCTLEIHGLQGHSWGGLHLGHTPSLLPWWGLPILQQQPPLPACISVLQRGGSRERHSTSLRSAPPRHGRMMCHCNCCWTDLQHAVACSGMQWRNIPPAIRGAEQCKAMWLLCALLLRCTEEWWGAGR